MGELYIMRHANSYYNDLNIYAGNLDIPLSARGIEKSLELGKHFQYHNFDMVFVSKQTRSYDTAIIFLSQITQLNKIPIHLKSLKELDKYDLNRYLPIFMCPELNERDYGVLQNLEKKESEKLFGKETIRKWRREFEEGPIGGEKFTSIVSRVANFYYDTLLPYIHSHDVLIVAHQNSIRALYYLMYNVLKDEINNIEFSNGEIVHIHFDQNSSIDNSYPKNIFVMAAGFGRRMGDLTKDTPKSLLTLNGYSMIDYSLSFFAQNDQYHATVIYGPFPDKWSGIISKYHKYNRKIEFWKTDSFETYEKQILITYAQIRSKSNYFIVYSADVLFDYRLFDVALSYHIKNNANITMVLSRDKGRWKRRDYILDDNTILDITNTDKPQTYERFFFIVNKDLMDQYLSERMTNEFIENKQYGEGACFMIKNLLSMGITVHYIVLNDILININDITDMNVAQNFILKHEDDVYKYMKNNRI